MEDTQAGLLDVRTEGHGKVLKPLKTQKERMNSLSDKCFCHLTVKEQPSLGSQEAKWLL